MRVRAVSARGAMVTRSITLTANPNGVTGPVPRDHPDGRIELSGGRVLELSVNRSKDHDDQSDLVLTEAELILIADDIAGLTGDALDGK